MFSLLTLSQWLWVCGIAAAILAIGYALHSTHRIGPDEVGLVTKRASSRRLMNDDPVAFAGEAGYQSDLLMPGLRWKSAGLYRVEKFPWVQVPAGEIGVVIAQVGHPLPIGAKSAVYGKDFGDFSDVRAFVDHGGQKGVQRPVLPPGTLLPIHPIGFLVITKHRVFGRPLSTELQNVKDLTARSFGLDAHQLDVVRIEPQRMPEGEIVDM